MGEVTDTTDTITIKIGAGVPIDLALPPFSFSERDTTLEGHTPEPNQQVIIYKEKKIADVIPSKEEVTTTVSDENCLFSVKKKFAMGYYTLFAEAGGEESEHKSLIVISGIVAALALIPIYYLWFRKGGK